MGSGSDPSVSPAGLRSGFSGFNVAACEIRRACDDFHFSE
jgi:hypothetical protein